MKYCPPTSLNKRALIGEHLEPRWLLAAVFDWEMEPRFARPTNVAAVYAPLVDANANNIPDMPNTCEYVHNLTTRLCKEDLSQEPAVTFNVTFDASSSRLEAPNGHQVEATNFAWVISSSDDEASDAIEWTTPSAVSTVRLTEGKFIIDLTIQGEHEGRVVEETTSTVIEVRDILFVALGDSFASGEGNPEREAVLPDDRAEGSTTWADAGGALSRWFQIPGMDSHTAALARHNEHNAAHRTSLAASAQAALELEEADPHTSVTFLFLAQTGARLDGHIPTQIDSARQIVGSQAIDVLTMSASGNDAGFSQLIRAFLDNDPFYDPFTYRPDFETIRQKLYDGNWDGLDVGTLFDFSSAPGLNAVPALFDNTAGLIESMLNVSPTNVFVTEYPDVTLFRAPNGSLAFGDNIASDVCVDACRLLFPFTALEIDQSEAAFIHTEIIPAINHEVANAAERHGWNFVGGIRDTFLPHGYAAGPGERWVRTAAESRVMQGGGLSSPGTLHPNELGHAAIKQLVLERLALGQQPRVTLKNKTITINGTNRRDEVLVTTGESGDLRLEVNGQVEFFQPADVDGIEFNGRRGQDVFENNTTLSSVVDGGPDNDRLFGGMSDDIIYGGVGSDEIRGRAGNDTLHGEHPTHNSSAGDWYTVGEFFDDIIDGGSENDVITGGPGEDKISSGPGADTLTVNSLEDSLNIDPTTDSVSEESGFNALLAYRWAPIHVQDVDTSGPGSLSGRSDYITSINFDGEWSTGNNWENAEHLPLPAHAYYSVTETTTHWFILYAFYHPRDWRDIFELETSHENDLEGALTVIRKPQGNLSDRLGTLEAMVTVSHNDFFSYTPQNNDCVSPFISNYRDSSDENIDGELCFGPHARDGRLHPITAQEARGHGLKAYPDFFIQGGDGVVYYPSLTNAEVPSHTNDRSVQYKLVDIFEKDGLWARRRNPETFAEWGAFEGDNGSDDAAHAPWAWDDNDDGIRLLGGELAFDPARLVAIYFDNLGQFSRTYTDNRYRGLTTEADSHLIPATHFFRPPLTNGGDREFDSHGPRVAVRTELRIGPLGDLQTRVSMTAEECQPDVPFDGCNPVHDFTTVGLPPRNATLVPEVWSNWRTAAIPPDGFRVSQILSPTAHEIRYVDRNNHVDDLINSHETRFQQSFGGTSLVQAYEAVGDTDGDEAGTRSGVTVHFNPVRVRLEPASDELKTKAISLPIFNRFGRDLVPRTAGGDDEFGGHGPLSAARVEIRLSDDLFRIERKVWFDAQEWENGRPKSNHTRAGFVTNWETAYTSSEPMYKILSPTIGEWQYLDRDHGEDHFDPRGDAGLVGRWRFRGDTDGNDANRYTGVGIDFNSIVVQTSLPP